MHYCVLMREKFLHKLMGFQDEWFLRLNDCVVIAKLRISWERVHTFSSEKCLFIRVLKTSRIWWCKASRALIQEQGQTASSGKVRLRARGSRLLCQQLSCWPACSGQIGGIRNHISSVNLLPLWLLKAFIAFAALLGLPGDAWGIAEPQQLCLSYLLLHWGRKFVCQALAAAVTKAAEWPLNGLVAP